MTIATDIAAIMDGPVVQDFNVRNQFTRVKTALTDINTAILNGTPTYTNFRNVLYGGDFSTNPWQRATTSGDIANTLTYTADRWFSVGGASSAINVTKTASATVAGFSQGLKFARKSGNTDVVAIKMGQALESLNAIRLQGRTVCFSFWATAGANFSAANSLLAVSIFTGTGSDESAANMAAGSWTGSILQAVTALQAVGTGGAQGVAGTACTQAISATETRYSFTAVIPAAATQVGVVLSYTPVGTAGAADNILFKGFQLEDGSTAGSFEHRDAGVELDLCRRYAFVVNEPAASVVVGIGQVTTSNNEVIFVNLPTAMRVAPTVTVGVTGPTWRLNVVGTPTAATLTAGATHTTTTISLAATTTATAGQMVLLAGNGGTGTITASAEL